MKTRSTKPGGASAKRGPAARAKPAAGNAEPYPLNKFRDGPSFDALSDQEKEKVAAYFERGISFEETQPLTAKERARWERVKRKKPGRPRIGDGAKVISLSMERGLLERADAYAKRAGISRAQLVAEGIELRLRAGDNFRVGNP